MRSDRAVSILRSILEMKDTRTTSSEIDELLKFGLVDKAEGPTGKVSDKDLKDTRMKLSSLNERKKVIQKRLEVIGNVSSSLLPRIIFRKDREYKDLVKELETIDGDERTLRTKIMDIVQNTTEMRYNAEVNGVPMILTFKGKEALITMEQRGKRISRYDLKSFLSEIEMTRAHFGSRMKKAKRILKKISPMYPQIDEIHLRMISVGLSGHKGSVAEIISHFKEVMDLLEMPLGLNDATEMVLAETLVLSSNDKKDLKVRCGIANGLCSRPFSGYATSQDQTRAVGIILSDKDRYHEIVDRTKILAAECCPEMFSPAALVACSDNPAAERTFRRMISERTIGVGIQEEVMATAIISISGLSPETVIESYREALAKIQSLGLKGMEITAAMLAVLPYRIDELLDNLRMASQAISLNKLSVGGIENISLGMKLLMTSSVISTGVKSIGGEHELIMGSLISDAPVHLALEGILVTNALTIAASMNAFHEVSLHRVAVSDYRFHPVHSHYVYG